MQSRSLLGLPGSFECQWFEVKMPPVVSESSVLRLAKRVMQVLDCRFSCSCLHVLFDRCLQFNVPVLSQVV